MPDLAVEVRNSFAPPRRGPPPPPTRKFKFSESWEVSESGAGYRVGIGGDAGIRVRLGSCQCTESDGALVSPGPAGLSLRRCPAPPPRPAPAAPGGQPGA